MLYLAFKNRMPCEYMTADDMQTFVQTKGPH